MKAAPNYIPGQAVDGKWKQELLIFLGEHFNLKTLIETGTCDGGTLAGVNDKFKFCFSIELSQHYFRIAFEKFKGLSHVSLIEGNSATELRNLLNKMIPSQCLFWLDAHPSGGLTANEGHPLPDEIKAIMELSPNSLVVIDDEPNDLYVKQFVNDDEWQTEYHYGITFLYKKGLYQIPAFE